VTSVLISVYFTGSKVATQKSSNKMRIERPVLGREKIGPRGSLVSPLSLATFLFLLLIYISAIGSSNALTLTKSTSNITHDAAVKTQTQSTDAPKFYYLNELLYKSASAKHSPQAAALPAYQQNKGSGVMQAAGNDDRLSQASPSGLPEKRQGPLRPRTMPSAGLPANDDDDYNDDGKTPADSSIDSLLRAMRKRNEGKTSPKSNGEAAERGEKIDSGSNLGNRANGARGDDRDDESTIQRKSTFDGDDEESHVAEKRPGLSNRLRGKPDLQLSYQLDTEFTS